MNKLIYTIFLTLFTVYCARSMAFQNTDNERMNRDIEVAESILQELLSPQKNNFALGGRTVRGIYLKGHGVLFQANRSLVHLLEAPMVDEDIEVLVEDDKKVIRISPPNAPKIAARNIADSRENRADEVRKQLTTFYTKYANTIGQLRLDEKITVLVESQSQFDPVFFSSRLNSEQEDMNNIIFSATKREIDAVASGKLSRKAFEKTFIRKEDKMDPAQRQQIDIMANILGTALQKKYHAEFGLNKNSNGAYLSGVGALFFLEADLGSSHFFPKVVFEKHLEKLHEQKKGESVDQKAAYDAFKNALTTLIISYGHTIDKLEPDEKVIVVVDFKHVRGSGATPEELTLTVAQKDLQEFSASKVSLEQMKKRIHQTER